MRHLFKIMNLVLVKQYYQANAGLFLGIFFVMFGIPANPIGYHLSIIQSILTSKLLLFGTGILWLIYALKCTSFFVQKIQQQEQKFLFILQLLPTNQQFILLFTTFLLLFVPVLAYAIWIMEKAIQQNLLLIFTEIIIFIIILILGSIFWCKKAIEKNGQLIQPIVLLKKRIYFPKPIFLLSLWCIWSNRKQMIFISKIVSFLLIYLYLSIYEIEQYDFRPSQLIALLCVLVNSMIIYSMQEAKTQELVFIKGFPISQLKQIVGFWLSYLLLFLPEILIFSKSIGVFYTCIDFVQLLTFMVAFAWLLNAILYIQPLTTEQYLQWLFAFAACLFFVILYNPGWMLSICLLLIGTGIWWNHWLSYEKKYG